jgi:hypothetical protein
VTWDNPQLCGTNGLVTLIISNEEVAYHFAVPDEYLIQIKIPASVRDKIIFAATDGNQTYLPGDLNVDTI